MGSVIAHRTQQIEELLDKPSLPPEVSASVMSLLREVRVARNYVLEDRAYENFALSYLNREVAKFKSDSDGRDDVGDRDDRLCTCGHSDCPLKESTLPRSVREARSIDDGILAFKRQHTGHPIVLDEIRVRWARLRADVEDVLVIAWRALIEETAIEDMPDDVTGDLDETKARLEDLDPMKQVAPMEA